MAEVFLVSHGSYSDYTVACVFSRRDWAEDYVRRMSEMGESYTDWNDVEAMPLDTVQPSDLLRFFVRSARNSIAVDYVSVDISETAGGVVRQNPYLKVHVEATDKEHATKIAADKFREFVAMEAPRG